MVENNTGLKDVVFNNIEYFNHQETTQHFTKPINNYITLWEMLPTEIVIYIFKIRNEIRNKACHTIQNAWKKYILLDIIAINYAVNIKIDQYNEIMVSIQSTHLILKICLNIVSGKRYLSFWKKIAIKLYNSLIINEPNEQLWLTPEAVNYRKIKYQYNKLMEKFCFDSVWLTANESIV